MMRFLLDTHIKVRIGGQDFDLRKTILTDTQISIRIKLNFEKSCEDVSRRLFSTREGEPLAESFPGFL